MKAAYVKYIKRHFSNEHVIVVTSIVNSGKTGALQKALNNLGANLSEDGILGYRTLRAINDIEDEADTWRSINSLLEKEVSDFKSILKNFLYQWEGNTVHYNAGEKSPTTPLGVYCYAWKGCRPCIYLKSLYKRHGLNYHVRSHARSLQSRLSQNERLELINKAVDFYDENFMDSIYKILVSKPKTRLSYFSIAVNGGTRKAVKIMQKVIGTRADGVAGPNTLRILKDFLRDHTDDEVNQLLLGNMRNFYVRLARRHVKYRRFLKGWMNRLKATGFRG